MKFKWVLLLVGLLALSACTPAAAPTQSANARAEAARGRFTIKLHEVWQMTAYKPGNQESQKFSLELYGEPEVYRGLLVADAEAGRFDASLAYNPKNDGLAIAIRLSNADDPDLLICSFESAVTGKQRYEGESLFATYSELQKDLPDQRYAKCTLELSK